MVDQAGLEMDDGFTLPLTKAVRGKHGKYKPKAVSASKSPRRQASRLLSLSMAPASTTRRLAIGTQFGECPPQAVKRRVSLLTPCGATGQSGRKESTSSLAKIVS